MKTNLLVAGWLATVLGVIAPAASSHGEEGGKRFTIWDIHLGDLASAIPNEYVNYACGTDGGPPSRPLPNFTAFATCKPGADGLHEVYFEYDDEQEYVARALQNRAGIMRYAGTTVFEFPVVASILFDDSGRVRGERMVTDPRQQVSRDRLEFWELATFLKQNFGDDPWTCKDLPPADGETPVGTRFFKNHCEKTVSGMHLIVEQRFFQKKGQQLTDPVSGMPMAQAFESATRFEMYDAALPQP